MRRAAKVDLNHGAIRTAFRALGCKVFDCSRVGGGFPDLCVQYAGITMLVEVKGEKGKLTQKQAESNLMSKIVRNMDDVAGAVNTLRQWHRLIREGVTIGAKKHPLALPINPFVDYPDNEGPI